VAATHKHGRARSRLHLLVAAEAERHEGATLSTDSHLGEANRLFASFRLHGRVEEMYRVGEPKLRVDADRLYRRWRYGAFKQAQAAYDAKDRPIVWNKVGCTLDLILTDAS
jgi:hypothetical protein